MSVYDRQAATAVKQIAKYGLAYTFEHIAKGEYEPALQGSTGDVTTEYTANALVTKFSKSFLPNAVTEVGDVALLSEPADFSINDTVPISGIKYRVLIADPLRPGDTVLLYKLQLRA